MNEPKFSKVAISLFWLSLLGAWAVLFVTKHWGLGLTTDSIVYVEAARNAASGQGFSVFAKTGVLAPLTYQPPAVPFLLSWSWYLGFDVYFWAKVLNALCFAFNIFLSGMLVFRATRRLRPAVLTGAAVLFSTHILEMHLRLLSEPLFLTLVLGSLLAVTAYVEKGRRDIFYAAIALAAAAALARYAGIAVAAGGAIAIWKLKRSDDSSPLRPAAFFLIAALAPLSLWLLRNMILTNGMTGRSLGLYLPSAEKMFVFINSLSEFFLPASTPDVLRWTVLGLVTGGAVAYFRKRRAQDKMGVPAAPPVAETVVRIFLWTYMVCLLLGLLAIGADLYINHRMLVPVYVAFFILAVPYFDQVLTGQTGLQSKTRIMASAVVGVLVVLMLMRTGQLGTTFLKRGLGYGSRAWDNSKLVKDIRALDNVPVYSNDPEAIYFLTGRPAVKVPALHEKGIYAPPGVIQDNFRSSRAVAIMFKPYTASHASWAKTAREIPLTLYAADDVVGIYGVKK